MLNTNYVRIPVPEIQPPRPRRRHRSARRRFRHGKRAAVLRAMTAADLYQQGEASSLVEAAEYSGSNVAYVRAMLTLNKTENLSLLVDVLAGELPLLVAAKQVAQLGRLVDAYRKASAADRVAFANAVGVGALWDETIAPAI